MSTCVCLNPDCLKVNHNTNICQYCQTRLLLTERYLAQRILGEGGFGRTFLGVDQQKPSQPPVVIKQLLPQGQGTGNNQKAADFFAKEAEQLEKLGKHPQIPELYAYFTNEGRQYLVQEYIKGLDLEKELKQKIKFTQGEIKELLQQVLEVLQFVHHNQVIHRDIKPPNLIRRQDGTLFLVDFGAAKEMKTQRVTVTGTVIGSAEYAAPEQMVGKPMFASDLYSLGVTCIHLLTGVSPFELYDTLEGEWAWCQFLDGNPVSNEFRLILDKLIEMKPKKRYQSVEEVLQDLTPSSTPPIPQFQPSTPPTPNSQPSTPKNRSFLANIFSRTPPTPQSSTPPTPQSQPPTPPIPKSQSSTPPIPKSQLPIPQLHSRYHRLRDLMAAGDWKGADQETAKVMLAVARREKEGWLDESHLDNFPGEDLRAINRLWVEYSQGHFGFSVQKQIYQGLGGTRDYDRKIWEAFGDRVGWRVAGKWVSYDDLNFNPLKSPDGHLPTTRGWGGWWVGGVLCGGVVGLGVKIISRRDLNIS